MYSLKEEKNSQITPFSVFADNKRIRNKIIEGKSVQDGTPTPEAPAEIQSVGDDVNLFDGELELGSINTSGDNVNSTVQMRSKNYIPINSNQQYSFSSQDYEIINDNIRVSFYDTNKTYISSLWSKNPTTPTNAKYCRFYFTNTTDTSIKIKLQKGTVATAYSEYGKGTLEIKQSGENIISSTSVSGGYNDIAPTITNGVINVKGTNNTDYNNKGTYINGFVHIKTVDRWEDNVTYYFSCKVEVISNQKNLDTSYFSCFLYGQVGFEMAYNSKTGRYEGKKETPLGSSAVEGKNYVEFRLDGCELNISEIMLCTEETYEYQPYIGNNYVIPLSQLIRSLPNGVCDTIEEDGIHRRVGSVVLDGSEEGWNKDPNTDNTNDYFYIKNIGIDINNIDSVICNRFEKGSMTSQGFWASTVFCITINKEYTGIVAEDTKEQRISKFKTWLSENPIQVDYELAEEVIEPLTEEQQAVINSMETFEGVNHFSLVGDLQTNLTFDYNPQITEEIKRAFKYNITKAYLEVAATDKASGFQINEDNYLQSIDFDDCRYIEGEGVIGSCVAKELQGKFVNVDTSFDIENREIECFIGAETEDNITHYLRLGTFIVQKPENDNVKDNTSFDSLDYMIKFNKEYVHRMAKYLKTEDTDIYPEKQYYILNDSGVYEEVIVPHKEEISNYYELIDEYTLMQLLKDICEQCEVKLGTFNFRNADYLVHGNRFDSGVSCRDVLKAIAQAAFSWARINEYNELLLDFETSDTITEEIDYNEYYDLSFNDKYGPVNTIVLKNSQAEGENITIKNEELINSAGGKNLLNVSNNYEVTLYEQLPINIPKGEYIITWENIVTNGEKTSMLMLFYYEDGTSISRYISNDYPSKSLVLKAEKNINRVNIYSQTSYANSTDITTTFYNLMISKNGGEYEDFIPLGIKELAISDNPFAYSEETRKSIIKAGEAIYGFKYVPLSVETIGAAYLNCKDKLKIKNMQDGDLETYVFDTRISYQGTLKSNVETLAMTDTETKYRYDGSLTTAQRRTEFRVDKAEQKITSLVKATTEQGEKITEAVQDLDGFKRTITDKTDETAEKVTIIEEKIDGLITSKSVSGGQNLIKNSVGYFGNDYWQINAETEGTVLSENSTDVKQNSISGSALKLQKETIYQDIKEIKNGEYYISFNYKRIINTAIATLKVNDLIIDLTEENWKEEAHLINVTSNNIKIEMTTDLNSSILITDLMLTEGNLQVSWTQNANESYTDTVQIGKGVRITATGSDTEFVAEASGITINNTESGTKVAEFTKYGTETQELVAHKDVKIADSLLIQKIGNQTWFSSL